MDAVKSFFGFGNANKSAPSALNSTRKNVGVNKPMNSVRNNVGMNAPKAKNSALMNSVESNATKANAPLNVRTIMNGVNKTKKNSTMNSLNPMNVATTTRGLNSTSSNSMMNVKNSVVAANAANSMMNVKNSVVAANGANSMMNLKNSVVAENSTMMGGSKRSRRNRHMNPYKKNVKSVRRILRKKRGTRRSQAYRTNRR